MRANLTAMLLIVALSASSALAQKPQPAPKMVAARIARLIDALDSAKYGERERATRDLLAVEGAAIEPIREALGKGRSVEFTRRANAILDALAIYELGGEVVNGLKVRLTADRATIKVGETVKWTTILCNMTDKPLNVMVGYTTCGNYFECGSALRRTNSVPGKPADDVEPKCQVEFCGTGAGPIYLTLAPKHIFKYETRAVLAQNADGKTVYLLGNDKYFTIDGTHGTDSIRMILTMAPGGHSPRPARPNAKGAGIRPADENAPFWTGAVRSNDVPIKFVPR